MTKLKKLNEMTVECGLMMAGLGSLTWPEEHLSDCGDGGGCKHLMLWTIYAQRLD